jgi:hypothetical protein
MSYNGSGTFQINTSGQPVVAGTVISSTAFNALTADLATGLSTAITKDGQTTATARIPFAQGISSTLTTDSSSVSTGSIITAGGVGIVKNLYVGANTNIAGTLAVTGVATFSAAPIYSSLTASSAVATDASKALVSVTNTGTGNNVLATSPTLVTPVLGAASATSITVAAGTVSDPAITTTGDTNTGIFFPAADTIAFTEGGAEAMRIDSSGSVRINNTSNATFSAQLNTQFTTAFQCGQYLKVTDTSASQSMFIFGNSSSDAVGSIATNGSATSYNTSATSGVIGIDASTIAINTASSERMRIDSSGNLLVGTTANAITAYNAGKSLIQSADYSGAVAQLINSTSTTGTQYFLAFGRGASVCGQITSGSTNSTSFTTSSDYRLKKDVQPITGALAKVQALKPCAYKWIEDDTTSEGFIAHELAETFPQAVVGEKDAVNAEGNPVYQGVDTSFLVATLTAAIQEQQALITAQAAQITAQQVSLDSLTARITALEAK